MGVPFFQGAELARAAGAMGTAFLRSGVYAASVPTYVGGVMAFGWGSRELDASSPAARVEASYAALGELRYYTPAVHRAAFVLPAFVQELLDAPPRP